MGRVSAEPVKVVVRNLWIGVRARLLIVACGFAAADHNKKSPIVFGDLFSDKLIKFFEENSMNAGCGNHN